MQFSLRDAVYMIDGLLHNNVVKSDTHFTDMRRFVRPAKSLTMIVAPELLGMRPAVFPEVPYSNVRDKQLPGAKLIIVS